MASAADIPFRGLLTLLVPGGTFVAAGVRVSIAAKVTTEHSSSSHA